MKKIKISFFIYVVLVIGCVFLIHFLVSEQPIEFTLHSFGDFFIHFFDNFLFFPLAYLLKIFSKLSNSCLLGIITLSLIIQIIENRINQLYQDNILRMQMAQKDIERIKEKYAEIEDEKTKSSKTFEIMYAYKKWGVKSRRIWLPILSWVIRIIVYSFFLRFSLSSGEDGSVNWVSGLNTTVFEFDLFAGATRGKTQIIGMVVVTGIELFLRGINYVPQLFIKPKNESDNKMFYMTAAIQIALCVWIFIGNAAFGIYWLVGDLLILMRKIIGWITTRLTQ